MSDLVTELHRELRDVNDHFASAVEQIVHLAPPAIVDPEASSPAGPADEELLAPAGIPPAEFQAKADELAAGLAQRFKRLLELVDKLPAREGSAADEEARIHDLLAEHQRLRAELGAAVQSAERKVAQVHGFYEVLADHALMQAGRMAS